MELRVSWCDLVSPWGAARWAWAVFHTHVVLETGGSPAPPLPPMVLLMLQPHKAHTKCNVLRIHNNDLQTFQVFHGDHINAIEASLNLNDEASVRRFCNPNWRRVARVVTETSLEGFAAAPVRLHELEWKVIDKAGERVSMPAGALSTTAACRALRRLSLFGPFVADVAADIAALHRLQRLTLASTPSINVAAMTSLCRGGPAHSTLTQLTLVDCTIADDAFASGVTHMSALRMLEVQNCKPLAVFSCLGTSTTLETVVISNTMATSAGLRGLELIPTLQHLTVRMAWQLSDVAFLSASRSLTALAVSCSSTDSGFAGLERSVTLRDVEVCGMIETATCFFNLPNLTRLSLSGSAFVGTTALINPARLTNLDLSYCSGLTAVGFLVACPALETLCLDHTEMSAEGLEGLERIPTLTYLSLIGCDCLTSVGCLGRSLALTTLLLDGSGVTSDGLAGLATLSTLTTLSVKRCLEVTSIDVLAGHPNPRLDIITNGSALSAAAQHSYSVAREAALRQLQGRLAVAAAAAVSQR